MSKTETTNKYQALFLSLLFDAIGMLSFTVPFIGEFSDVIWAPVAGWLMTRLYKGKVGKAAGFVTFAEELFLGTDFVPTFTIMWVYTHVFKKKTPETIIDITE